MNTTLLRESLQRILKQREAFATTFYQRLQQQHPRLQLFFEDLDMRKQHASLLTTLAMVVVGLEREEDLIPAFRKLGRLHHKRQIRPAHYPAFSNTLMETMALFDPEWTEAHQVAWSEALDHCVRGMMESYESGATLQRIQINGVRSRSIEP
jgi:hemoglobin-like flavoprotein